MILTYIHSADHQDTDKFCSQVLFGNELITEYINEVRSSYRLYIGLLFTFF